ncbi:phage tail protein [Pseudomonas sp. TH43]|uniref:phage tail protein n=1 Tax=Pseudomonas sp. TH43 TaxID=2796407 RepID=UPI001F5BF03E|nr:phage tail protein [Pseudomonas sp. TH43]
MPWYKSGTVSVTQNSNAVIGTGTAFIANSRVGDGFRGPDGRWYEVTNIASNTALSISPNYEGPTATGSFYSIMPVQGYQKDLSDQVRAILNDYGEKLAALGTTGNYEILPPSKGGTGITDLSVFIEGLLNDADAAAARATLGAAKSGANNDITSLTALTTAVPVSMGGTGGKTQAAARTGLGLGSAAVAAIVGTVSQSGGVPTGAIVERGSNANGEFVRYADGTQICWRVDTFASVAITGASGYIFFASPAPSVAYAVAFVSTPATIQFFEGTGASWSGPAGAASATAWPACYPFAEVAKTLTGARLSRIAIGRWF